MIEQLWVWIAIAGGILAVLGGLLIGLVRGRGGRTKEAPRPAPRADTTETEVLPGVGHFVPEEAPDVVADRVRALFG